MLKKLFFFLSVALLLGAIAYGADPAAAPASTTTPKIEGTIQKIDMAKHTMTVMVGTESKIFTFSTKTKFMMDTKAAKSTDLKEGQMVAIEADAKNWAKTVTITTPPAK